MTTPLFQAERDAESLRKEVEEKIKTFGKIDLKSSNRDSNVYKDSLQKAIDELEDYSTKCKDFLTRITELKKDDELPTLRDKDFTSRQNNLTKKIKDIESKIQKSSKSLTSDLEKQKKVDEKEDAKKAALEAKKSAQDSKNDPKGAQEGSAISGLLQSFGLTKKDQPTTSKDAKDVKKDEKDGKKDKKLSKEDQVKDMDDDDDDDDDDDEEDNQDIEKDKKPAYVKGLHELMREEKVKFEQRKESDAAKAKEVSQPANQQEVKGLKELMREEAAKFKLRNEQASKDDVLKDYEKHIQQHEENDQEEDLEDVKKAEAPNAQKSVVGAMGSTMKPKSIDQNVEDRFKPGTQFKVIRNFAPAEEDEIAINKGDIVEFSSELEDDPDYIEVKKKSTKEIGVVPLSHLEVLKDSDAKQVKADSEKEVKAKEEKPKPQPVASQPKKETVASSQFSNSTLGVLAKNKKYSEVNFLRPHFSESGLCLRDFQWDSVEGKIRGSQVDKQKVVTIHKCLNMPPSNKEEGEVVCRLVRVALFDGASIVSNVHTIRAHISTNGNERQWEFEDENSNSVLLTDYSEFFFRTKAIPDKPNMGLLFELSVYARPKDSDEVVESGYGWCHLPFQDPSNKALIANKTYTLNLNGGSIFNDKNMPLDPSVSRNTGKMSEIFNNMFKESKIKFTVRDPNNQHLEVLGTLPHPLVGSTLVAPYIQYYREELALNYLEPLNEFGSFEMSTEPYHSPFLTTFPKTLTNLDVLEAARRNFIIARDSMKRDEKNNHRKQREKFIEIFNEVCYPLLHMTDVPKFNLSDPDAIEVRQVTIDRVMKSSRKKDSGMLDYLLKDTFSYKPFSIDELRYDLIS